MSSIDFSLLFNDENSGFFVMSSGEVIALCVVVKSVWETGYFDVPMARLYCFAAVDFDENLLSELVDKSLRHAFEKSGTCHFSIDVDIDNYKVINSLSGNGFEILDLKRTYFTNKLGTNPEFSRSVARVRNYTDADADVVREIIAAAKFETRFTRDRFLRKDASDALYQQWFLNLVKDSGSGSHVVVFERMGRVVGCGGIGEMSFSRYGIDRKMRTGSLYACSSEGVGGYAPVLYRLTSDAIASHGLVETTVSLNNASAVRVVEGVRPNRSTTSYAMRRFIQ
ncbi:MAG TPA: hypothetical protein DF427_07890 [Moraxellaceae bacterium]|nr:hypothetical protein [Moraxellaceae bacterium]